MISTSRKSRFLDSCARISTGNLRLYTPSGHHQDFGQGAPAAEMRIHDWAALSGRSLAKSYAAGLWDSDSLGALCALMLSNPHAFKHSLPRGINTPTKGVGIGNEFFQLLLDPGMSLSAGLFEAGDPDLSQAQSRKYNRVLDRLAPGLSILDIGCGWGSFAERAADRGYDVTGLTLNAGQKGYADARLDGRADIRHQDFRKEHEIYDNIVSIEQLNTLSPRLWPTFFAQLRSRLAQGGRIVLQAVTTPDAGPLSPVPTVEKLQKLAKNAGLTWKDSFSFGPSYARTFATWQNQLETNNARLSHMDFDTAFQREWRIALAASSARFRTAQRDVLQIDLTHQRRNQ
ncbi:class I SAM-dependent methyltransferase [Shimia abyssi]|uniref:Cyclopropane-fatty-acyl-phospholipid synthase n=1 Tax=Shimia abyssi TaxID=1662395 RepID=A0A2P8FIV1_9RHOB|nr:class I SAM-dependent methyltransferase [Shimia abyssi]PSL21633.1 cyclopropane-fatty-acyl-phospholipid synthase [Shimia abyssi]